VERPGQKRILIGTGGEMMKRIGTDARRRIQELTGRKVNLKLWVRVVPAWRQSAAQLDELGYRAPARSAAAPHHAVDDILPEEAAPDAPPDEDDDDAPEASS
jgi:GTP-binding protein Era